MTSKTKPGAGSDDVIGGALALGFDENEAILEIIPGLRFKWGKFLQTLRRWRYLNLHNTAVPNRRGQIGRV
jgi:hypothetical protein